MAVTQKTIIKNLVDLGLSKTHAYKAYLMFGSHALSEIRNDPYQLIVGNDGTYFYEIDKLAYKLGISESAPERISGAIRYALINGTSDGHVYVPMNELMQRTSRILRYIDESALLEAMQELGDQRAIRVIQNGDESEESVYLYPLYLAEKGVAHRLVEMDTATSKMALQAPSESDLNQVERELNIKLAPAQREAISASLEHKIVIITGGPGTGKTTILQGVLRLWEERGAKIRLAAPTGRAARRLTESTGRKAQTIHRLLEYNPEIRQFNRHAGRRLSLDLMVVDEASMIDTELMASLLEALPPSAHLLMVGDVNQLPAVGPGLVLFELIESGFFKTICLSQIFRQVEGSLISINAQKINQGEMPEVEGKGFEAGQDFFFIQRPNGERIQQAVIDLVTERIPNQMKLNPKFDVQVLCPMIKYDVGVERMNEMLQACLNPGETRVKSPFYSFSVGDKIMQTKNDYKKDVFNGDIGYVVEINKSKKRVILNFDGVDKTYEWKELENTSLAYAVTVHKSQGSEYPAVLIPLSTRHFPMLQRNLLYTAVSRGKQLVILVGHARALQLAIQNNKIRKRYTALRQMLQEGYQEVKNKKKKKRKR